MTNGEKIKEIFPNTKIITQYDNSFGDRFMVFTLNKEHMQVNIDWWNAEYQEPTTKNDLGVDCISRDDVWDVMQELWGTSGELMDRLMALPSVTPQYSSGLEKNSKKLEKDFGESDCISRADARKAIIEYQYSDSFCEEHNIDHSINTSVALLALSDLPSVTPQEPKWVPVSERLPKAEYGESNSVLVCFENETQDVLYFNGSNWCYPTGEIYISVNHKNGWHNKVVAWMPLPKPYEPQESEDKR